MAPYDRAFHADLVDALLAGTHGFLGQHTLGTLDGTARRLGVMLLLYSAALTFQWDEAEGVALTRALPGVNAQSALSRAMTAAVRRVPPSEIWDVRIALAEHLEAAHRAMHAVRAEAERESPLPTSSSQSMADLMWGAATRVAEEGLGSMVPLFAQQVAVMRAHSDDAEASSLGGNPMGWVREQIANRTHGRLKLLADMATHILHQLRALGTARIAGAAADELVGLDPEGVLHAIKVMGAVESVRVDDSARSVSVSLLPALHSRVMPDPVEARATFVAAVQAALQGAFDRRAPAYMRPRSCARAVAHGVLRAAAAAGPPPAAAP